MGAPQHVLFQESEMAAVKLTEIGPRMRLSLVKVEEGFCSGEVLFHKHVKKTPEEVAALRAETHRYSALANRRAQRDSAVAQAPCKDDEFSCMHSTSVGIMVRTDSSVPRCRLELRTLCFP